MFLISVQHTTPTSKVLSIRCKIQCENRVQKQMQETLITCITSALSIRIGALSISSSFRSPSDVTVAFRSVPVASFINVSTLGAGVASVTSSADALRMSAVWAAAASVMTAALTAAASSAFFLTSSCCFCSTASCNLKKAKMFVLSFQLLGKFL